MYEHVKMYVCVCVCARACVCVFLFLGSDLAERVTATLKVLWSTQGPTHRLRKLLSFSCLRTAGRARAAPHAVEPSELRRCQSPTFHPESLEATVLQHVSAYDSRAMS